MMTAEARVQTEHPARYLSQLCQHVSKMGGHLRHRPRRHDGDSGPPEIRHAECSETDGIVTLDIGQWTMHASPGALRIRAEAGSEENLRRIQDLLTARLEKIGRRDRLTVNWQAADLHRVPLHALPEGYLPGLVSVTIPAGSGAGAGCWIRRRPS